LIIRLKSVKSGNCKTDTIATPYESLLAYKAYSSSGIRAKAPFYKMACSDLERCYWLLDVGFNTGGCDKMPLQIYEIGKGKSNKDNSLSRSVESN